MSLFSRRDVARNLTQNLVADLYIVLLESIWSNPATGHGREGIYFGENGEHSLYEIGKAVGEAMVDLGKSEFSEPTTFTKEEINKYFGVGDFLLRRRVR